MKGGLSFMPSERCLNDTLMSQRSTWKCKGSCIFIESEKTFFQKWILPALCRLPLGLLMPPQGGTTNWWNNIKIILHKCLHWLDFTANTRMSLKVNQAAVLYCIRSRFTLEWRISSYQIAWQLHSSPMRQLWTSQTSGIKIKTNGLWYVLDRWRRPKS